MERIVHAVREARIDTGGETVTTSVSVGGSWAPGGVKATAESLVAAADRSLYAAKNAGRDRAATPEPFATPQQV
jgi:PleD family two-component response regulator